MTSNKTILYLKNMEKLLFFIKLKYRIDDNYHEHKNIFYVTRYLLKSGDNH